jgi:single-strand DNA-binding protein
MSSLNRVTLIGNLTRDPESRTTQSGAKVVNLSMATNESWKDKTTGERKEKAEFHRVVIFNDRLADVAEKYLKKGSKIYLEGAIQTRHWEKDGAKVYTTEIVLQQYRGEIVMLDGRGEKSGAGMDEEIVF